jgi:hypothetical protein
MADDTPPVLDHHELVEETLATFRDAIGRDLAAYRGHVYRVFNVCRALHRRNGGSAGDDDKIALAAVFHDIGIWTDGTVDYLPPSAERLRARLQRDGRDAWADELARMVELHHKLTPCRGDDARLVEAFRRSDLVDLSFGLVRFGLPREEVRAIQAAFPNAGFHGRVVRLVGGWALTHPLRPLPMFRL